jgi:anaerobic selenocysteine-containing dehydrogenase
VNNGSFSTNAFPEKYKTSDKHEKAEQMPELKTKTHYSTCVLCEAMCGIQIKTQGKQVISIRGDEEDPFSGGYICPKAPALKDLHEDPDRLRHPMRREGDSWKQVSWSEALDETAQRIGEIQLQHGQDAMGIYYGNPTVHNLGAMLFMPPFLKTLATRNQFVPTSTDQLPHMLVSYLMFGHQFLLPIPDIDRTDFMLILGANPLASNGSMMSAPNVRSRLKAIQARGGKVVLIDPRRTETAKLADEHHFIRPESDALLLFSILHCLLKRGGNANCLDAPHVGLEIVRKLAQDFPPEATAAVTGISAAVVHRLAEQLTAANSAVCYGRVGTSTQLFGALCAWLINLINVVTGNFDSPGGAMFTNPLVDLINPKLGERGGFRRWASRVRELPEFSGDLPVGTLADEMLVDGPGRIRGMITSAGNPVLSAPNGKRLDRAFESLDFMVSVDCYLNETTRHANIILPPVSPLERDHYDLVFRLLAVRNTAKFSAAVFAPPSDGKHDWQILLELQNRIEKNRHGWRPTFAIKQWMRKKAGPRGLLSLAMLMSKRNFKWRHGTAGPSLKELKQNPHGVDLGPLTKSLPDLLPPQQKQIDLAPKPLVDDVDRLKRQLQSDSNEERELVLIGRRDLRSNNSWMHNSSKLMSGKPRCVLFMNPEDALRRGILESTNVQVTSRIGTIQTAVTLTDTIMPGVVSLPHGFGHHRPGVKLRVAQQNAGVSINDLTDDFRIDELCGNAAFCGVPVQVESA